ncbi:MAG: ABC transporter ATP-binding protein [Deltaproteobacteria bacterium]|nr:ABC transporter ATP-binding protein [Deltaproteobacteria bacterium]
MFALKNVTVELGGTAVLKNISLEIREGERVVILGINGCGKTTLLKLLNGLLQPAAGEILYRGEPLAKARLDHPEFKRAFRKDVVLLFQHVDAMLFNPTVRDEIAFGPRQFGLPEIPAIVDEWARVFELAQLLERAPFELSGGEKKRVALAAIMAVGPRVLLLDEPTAHLDPAAAGRLVDFLAGLDGKTIVAATHNLSIIEELGDRTIVLGPDHAVAYDGPTHDLFHDEALLVSSGLAHRHIHKHLEAVHAHYHVHDME